MLLTPKPLQFCTLTVSVFKRQVRFTEQIATTPPNSIKWLAFVAEMQFIYREVDLNFYR
jgi:hypothetical protein